MFKTPSLKPLPKQGDPRKFAQQGISLQGFVPVEALPRLAEAVQDASGDLHVDLAFAINEEKKRSLPAMHPLILPWFVSAASSA
jgi:uncharacterized protein